MSLNPAKCDLHIHSIFSDSDQSIENIFDSAIESKLSCISITDHDTIDGLDIACQQSQLKGVELIPGIELSVKFGDAEVHILGYFIDLNSDKLKNALLGIRELRVERLRLMSSKLNAIGIKVDVDELFSGIKGALPTRLHLGAYLTSKGYTRTLKESFRKYLSPRKPAYVSNFRYNLKEGIALIKASGGLTFLAHPHLLPERSWVYEFISCGIDGIELIYPNMPYEKQEFFRSLVKKNDLLVSGGSDAHGTYKEFTRVGGVTLGYEHVEKMKQRLIKPQNLPRHTS